jgi:hypothetical protein
VAAGIIVNSCIAGLALLSVYLIPANTPAPRRYLATCPICGRKIPCTPDRYVLPPHTDKAGRACPMSGMPAGATR